MIPPICFEHQGVSAAGPKQAGVSVAEGGRWLARYRLLRVHMSSLLALVGKVACCVRFMIRA